ncbi:hypothetical protein ASPWEDRAFT_44070 [Aspergillus wentii DTO 134E9]|uniref:Uncharacterized protein n=1 Tax=Aspergillus wentii DTO 134E9 TaxID=1073089 RepID=A0A1L9RAY3_ASPWE|nr:uncharacterized protein ASPWEDRAFT_44070 [Aspergillus wentii DTO 134E9]KAI9934627.1 hypothetical protein MW887_000243 [Aspergillus wentii]OJJ32048.1 hypothetical protein ASPWEDRAFT_44070 [Aspergillus wentii DTO 134E9]
MEYSPVDEAERIFHFICSKASQLGLPDIKYNAVFTTIHNIIYYPIPYKVTETLAALKGIEGCIASAIANLQHPPEDNQRTVTVNLEKATIFGFQAIMAKVDGSSHGHPDVKAKLKNTDLHAAQSNIYRRMAVNLYQTKNEGEYFHLHGSLDPSATLEMVGLQSHRLDLTDVEEIYALIQSHVRRYSAEELEVMNSDRRQAGVTAYKYEDFIKTPHGAANIHEPWWSVSSIETKTPPTPFPSNSRRILQGIKVLELCRVIAGPIIGRTLAEYGADVLKITSPNLPDVPFFQVDGNMSKHTADLDLKTDEGRRQFEVLLMDADVVIDGYRPGALDKLGYSIDNLTELAERRGKGIVYVSENCFGYRGEWADRPGWQQIADCLTGFAWSQGAFMKKSTPIVSPFPIADYGAGCMGTIAALTGLYNRAKYGGSYHGKSSLMQFNLLLFACEKYPEAILNELRDAQPAEFFELRYSDGVHRSCALALEIMRKRFPWLFTSEMTEKWYSDGFDAEIEVAKPVVQIEGVENSFSRASRPNGTDRPCWEDFNNPI